jgi:hypothetical protein
MASQRKRRIQRCTGDRQNRGEGVHTSNCEAPTDEAESEKLGCVVIDDVVSQGLSLRQAPWISPIRRLRNASHQYKLALQTGTVQRPTS